MIDESEQCYICGRMYGLEKHHCIHGNGRRQLADEDGLIVYLCFECHRKLHDKGWHDHDLQFVAQVYYEAKIGTREQFRERYGKSYIGG